MAFANKEISGTLPDFGAIFMSNMKTKDECFSKKVFGLPFPMAQFIENVKAGMILFLFEYERRKLYGVFEAVSDGRMNIVPYAYHFSGKSFPAQVQFRIIWRCQPLSEREFRGAIEENYYATYKFNFGLSKDQVHRLLCLFDSRRTKIRAPLQKKKAKKRPSKHSDDQNPSVNPEKLSAQNSDSSFTSELNLSEHTEKSSFQHPTASTINSCITSPSASDLPLSGDPSVQLLKETELVDVSSSASCILGDFIPLSSPENSKTAEIEISCGQSNLDGSSDLPAINMGPCISSALLLKSTEFIDVSSSASLELGDFIPLSSSPESFELTEVEIPYGHSNIDGSSALPALDADPCDSKYQESPEHYPRVKGMYSDALHKERTSVFSRLKLNARCAGRENEDNSGTPNRNATVFSRKDLDFMKERYKSLGEGQSVELIMEILLERQKSWLKKDGKETRNILEKRKNFKRASVFSRLNLNSEVTKQQKGCTNAETNGKENEKVDGVKQISRGKKTKRGLEVCNENHDHDGNSCVTFQVENLENAYMAIRRRLEEGKPFLNTKPESEPLKPVNNNENEGCEN